MAEASSSAQRRWELENNVQPADEVEGFFRYNQAEQQAIQQQKPWSKEPHLFKQLGVIPTFIGCTTGQSQSQPRCLAVCESRPSPC